MSDRPCRHRAGPDSPEASPTLFEIVLDVLGDRDIPVLGNVEFGHAGPNLPMPVGIRVGLDTQQRTLSLLEPPGCTFVLNCTVLGR